MYSYSKGTDHCSNNLECWWWCCHRTLNGLPLSRCTQSQSNSSAAVCASLRWLQSWLHWGCTQRGACDVRIWAEASTNMNESIYLKSERDACNTRKKGGKNRNLKMCGGCAALILRIRFQNGHALLSIYMWTPLQTRKKTCTYMFESIVHSAVFSAKVMNIAPFPTLFPSLMRL